MDNKQDNFAGKDEIISYYEELLNEHGDSHLALDYNSKASQDLRFAVFLEVIGYTDIKKNISILDVGCGVGHFYDYLKEQGLIKEFGIKYTGIDISKKLIGFAKEKNPKVEFNVTDLLQGKFDKKYDFVMESGIFNVRMSDIKSHKESVFKMISRMFNIANKAVSLNFISSSLLYAVNEEPESSRYVFFSPEEMISFCKTLTKRYLLRHDYRADDFTIYLFK